MINTFIEQFKYDKGLVFMDGWRLLQDKENGDCDDFALTIAYKMANSSLIHLIINIMLFKTVFWMVKSPSNKFFPRHLVLWQCGHGWIDSTNRSWRPTATPHKLRWPMLFPWVLLRMVWGALYKLLP